MSGSQRQGGGHSSTAFYAEGVQGRVYGTATSSAQQASAQLAVTPHAGDAALVWPGRRREPAGRRLRSCWLSCCRRRRRRRDAANFSAAAPRCPHHPPSTRFIRPLGQAGSRPAHDYHRVVDAAIHLHRSPWADAAGSEARPLVRPSPMT